MKKYILALLFLSFRLSLFSQNISGDWYGLLKAPTSSIRIIFHIVLDSNRYLSTMDIPEQGAKRLLMDSTMISDGHVRLKMSAYTIYYNGTYYADSNIIKGIFNQGAFSIPLNLSRTPIKAPEVPARPQDPISFPYKQEEVVFKNPKSSNSLSGTLTIPTETKPGKLIILLAGSGPNNRNEELGAGINHRPFLVWSDFLTRNGYAVLRFDKRGIGKSTGDYGSAKTSDFASDAQAAIDFVQSRPDLKGLSLGLMGHSEGGILAPLLASRNPSVKFVVMLAGPGVPLSQLMIKQRGDFIKLSGGDEKAVKSSDSLFGKIYTCMNANKAISTQELYSKLFTIIAQSIKNEQGNGQSEEKIQQTAKAYTNALTSSPWLREFISYQPDTYLSKLKCPVLALNGTLDYQVDATENLNGIKTSLEKAGNTNYEIDPMPNLNHLFQKAKTGSLSEYSQIPETVDPEALNKVLSWIQKLP